MKTNSIIALIVSISLFGLFGCADKYEVDYEAPVKIEFTGVDQNNRVSLEKGVTEYTAAVKVQGEIMSFEIYQADSKTGIQGSLIEETVQSFEDGTANYETTYKFTSLKENAALQLVVLVPTVILTNAIYGRDYSFCFILRSGLRKRWRNSRDSFSLLWLLLCNMASWTHLYGC